MPSSQKSSATSPKTTPATSQPTITSQSDKLGRPKDPEQSDQLEKPNSLPVGETPVKSKISRNTIIKAIIFSVVILALVGYLAWDLIAKGPLTQLLSNRDQLVHIMNSAGPLAPLIYILLQIIQVVVAPIPGQIVGGVGGFLFGHWGILWTSIGSIIGFWLVFLIARKFGRPLLEKIFKKPVIEKFDFIINAQGAALIIFAIFLLPGFPDDVVCYIAGLTRLSMRKLLTISILGRFPTIVLTNYIGMGISGNLGLVLALSIIAVLFIAFVTWKREAIISFLKHGSNKTPKS